MREKLVDLIKQIVIPFWAGQIADHLITNDVVPVVRCRKCKHYHTKTGWCNVHSSFIDSNGGACHPWESSDWKMFEPDDFCSYGERKDGEG